ncbi:MAG TPA: ABC transporter ATP-binding protein [Capsulimonadaceae bacterium]|nr:ABC transporter ATP-binding protein [Capsulimonadaceae bacterium]
MTQAIQVDNLSKSYVLRHQQTERYTMLREEVMQRARIGLRRLVRREGGPSAREEFWALKDVSFNVNSGDRVGVIGRNGAGKSTLLKVLSRITEPTKGRLTIHGRVASLLEVGTGFHPELTGRENIYLNGAILGMSKAEIKHRFDEIVAFAEVEKFLDTPVKRYSSGMYVRLAFAVAAHLEPEILIVDEVLAVGDTQFQKKCFGRMEEIGREGRTVIFVSHNIQIILRLCNQLLFLDRGRLEAAGDAEVIARRYLESGQGTSAIRTWANADTAPGDDVARLRSVRVLDSFLSPAEVIDIQYPTYIEIEYWNLQAGLRPTVSMHLINEEGTVLFASNDFTNKEWLCTPRTTGIVRARCEIPGNFLAEGCFTVLAAVCTYDPDIVHAIERDAISFQVVDRSGGEGVRGTFGRKWPGVVRPMLQWEVGYADELH